MDNHVGQTNVIEKNGLKIADTNFNFNSGSSNPIVVTGGEVRIVQEIIDRRAPGLLEKAKKAGLAIASILARLMSGGLGG